MTRFDEQLRSFRSAHGRNQRAARFDCERLEERSLLSTTAAVSIAPPTVSATDVTPMVQSTAVTSDKFFLTNNTKGAFNSGQIYFAILGLIPGTSQFAHVDASGNLVPMKVSDNTASNSLKKNGKSYSNYFLTASQIPSAGLNVPKMDSGRIYISVASPLYIEVRQNGYAGPDLNNRTDPNQNVIFDTIEFTLDNAGFHGNTTQVDFFSIPMTLTSTSQNNTAQKVGITLPRNEIFSNFPTKMPAPFKGLVEKTQMNGATVNLRIIAPKHALQNNVLQNTYYNAYIDAVWKYYTSHTLSLPIDLPGQGRQTYVGKVVNNQFVFTNQTNRNAPTETFNRPTNHDVIASDGVFVGGSTAHGNIGKVLDAAFNRHVASNPGAFNTVSAYYGTAPSNYYASYWHSKINGKPVSINNKAYGFDFDDVNEQSSSINDPAPKSLTISVSWN